MKLYAAFLVLLFAWVLGPVAARIRAIKAGRDVSPATLVEKEACGPQPSPSTTYSRWYRQHWCPAAKR